MTLILKTFFYLLKSKSKKKLSSKWGPLQKEFQMQCSLDSDDIILFHIVKINKKLKEKMASIENTIVAI